MRGFALGARIGLGASIGFLIALIAAFSIESVAKATATALLLTLVLSGIGFILGTIAASIPIRPSLPNEEEDDYRELDNRCHS